MRRRREELSAFLRSRRARISPGEVGLPSGGGRRRTPGLRREEVAALAGVSLGWYTWLEQGRDITVTASVLDAIGSALRLSAAEHAHLYRLAGHVPPERTPSHQDSVPDSLASVLRGWDPHPAYVLDRHWRFVAGNTALSTVFGSITPGLSCLEVFDDDSPLRQVLPAWERMAPDLVSEFRVDVARYPDDPEFRHILRRLRANSALFERLWGKQEVRVSARSTKEIDNGVVGQLTFDSVTVRTDEHPQMRVVLLSPRHGTPTASRLAALSVRH
nr:helix-turn-helix transcriptional regulator [Streptoalloteichus tenebrarius]